MASNTGSDSNSEDTAACDSFSVVSLEIAGSTDLDILDCLMEISLLSVGGVPRINSFNFEATKAKFKKIFPWEKDFEIRRAGSTIDLLFITKFSVDENKDGGRGKYLFNTDLDTLFIPQSVVVSNGGVLDSRVVATIESSTLDSYVKLKYHEECAFKLPESILSDDEGGSGKYISSQKFLTLMEGYMNVVQTAVEITGPSLAVLPQRVLGTSPPFTSVDIVFAFRNEEWPQLAMDWITRERPNNWPPQQDIDDIFKMGSHVVPKGNKLSPKAEFENQWRLSFNMAERRLAELMTTKQRQCFLVTKGLVKVLKSKSISSYSLKTILWWMLETGNPEVWEKERLGQCLLIYLDEIIAALEKYEIRNYFMPANNLIAHANKREIDKVLECLRKARQAPISAILGNYLLMENAEAVFHMSPDKEYHFDQLRLSLENFNSQVEKKGKFIRICKYHFINLGPVYVVDPNTRDKAVRFLTKYAELQHPRKDASEFVREELFLNGVTALKGASVVFSYSCLAVLVTLMPLETIEKKLQDYGVAENLITQFLINVACCLHRWSRQSFWSQQRTLDLKYSEQCFQYLVQKNENHVSCLTEFAHFLLVEDRFEEAREFSLKAIKATDTECKLCYDEDELDIIETCLARHAQHEGKIVAPARVFAFHLHVQANKSLGRLSTLHEAFFSEYKAACEDTSNVHRHESLAIFGYSCMAIGDYRKAKQAFIAAEDVRESKLMEENINICNHCLSEEVSLTDNGVEEERN